MGLTPTDVLRPSIPDRHPVLARIRRADQHAVLVVEADDLAAALPT